MIAMGDEKRTCGTCKWFRSKPMDLRSGECLGTPPSATSQVVPGSGVVVLTSRPVPERGWSACKEYEPRGTGVEGAPLGPYPEEGEFGEEVEGGGRNDEE